MLKLGGFSRFPAKGRKAVRIPPPSLLPFVTSADMTYVRGEEEEGWTQ
jgi:hypothetical protein